MPPAERTLAKPLSGAEILEAMVTKIRHALSRDCFLSPHLAYASYSFQADIRFQFQHTGTAIKESQVHVTGQGGEVTTAEMESIDIHVSDEPKPPNEVRVETGQGVPTQVVKPQGGVEEKKVRYDVKNLPKKTTAVALGKR